MRQLLWVLPLGALLLCNSAIGEQAPKWEAGVALGGQTLRDYRGSKERQTQAYPIPFFVYRGSFLKADRNGVRGEFLANDRLELNLSGETSLNGQSDDNALRQGMDELESAFELGPSINVNLSGENFSTGWQLRMPLRAVVTAGRSGVHHQGFTFNPRFTYTYPNLFGSWRGKVNFGVLYGSESYHDYYYSVDQQEVTKSRPYYEAHGGFSGYYFKSSMSRRKGDFWYAVSLRYDNLREATFNDSPLVETEDYIAISFAIAWINWKSKH